MSRSYKKHPEKSMVDRHDSLKAIRRRCSRYARRVNKNKIHCMDSHFDVPVFVRPQDHIDFWRDLDLGHGYCTYEMCIDEGYYFHNPYTHEWEFVEPYLRGPRRLSGSESWKRNRTK